MRITKAQYDQVVAQRDQALQDRFELRDQVDRLQRELARARGDAAFLRMKWNSASNEAKRLFDRQARKARR